MIPMKFQSEKYAGSSINKHTLLLVFGSYNLLPVLTNHFLMNQLLLEKRRYWGKKRDHTRISEGIEGGMNRPLAFKEKRFWQRIVFFFRDQYDVK